MHEGKVASLYSAINVYSVHPWVPSVFHKTPYEHFTCTLRAPQLPSAFLGTEPALLRLGMGITVLRPGSADLLEVHFIQKLPQHP